MAPIKRISLYLNGTQNSKGDIHAPAGFESAIPASKHPQTHTLDRTAIAIGALPDSNINSRLGK